MLDHGTLDADGVSPVDALRQRLRHSAAHVMADAVLTLFPEAKMGIGPPIQDGFIMISRWPGPSLPKIWSKSRG